MSKHIARVLQDAVASGLIEAPIDDLEQAARPWPVVVITALMTALAAIALCGLLFMVFLQHAHGWQSAIVGGITVACAAAILAARPSALFIEYAAASFMASGLIFLYFNPLGGVTEALPGTVALLLSCLVPQPWIRATLAAAAVWLIGRAFDDFISYNIPFVPWPAWYGSACVWLVAHIALQKAEKMASYRVAEIIESILIGSGLAIIVMLAYASGPTFLVSGTVFFNELGAESHGLGGFIILPPLISIAAVVGAASWLARKSAASHLASLLLATVVLAVLGYFSLSLGALILMGTANFRFHRKGLTLLCGLAGLWTIGSLYYAFDWPLLHKSVLLLGAAGALLASSRLMNFAVRQTKTTAASIALPDYRWRQWALLVPAGVIVLAVNANIWKNEQLIRQGTTIFVELAPVDPRSLMQGDYMTLRFNLPAEIEPLSAASGFAVAKRADNGVAIVTHWHDGVSRLRSNEVLIEVVRRGDRNVLVTDAWYFEEGDADRWSSAKYGEFRIDGEGKAILVGLRNQALVAISNDAKSGGNARADVD